MKKEIVTIIVVIILIIGACSIYVILNPYELGEEDYNEPTKFKYDNYALVSETNTYKEYEFEDVNSLDLYIDKFNLQYKNSNLKINDVAIAKNIYLYKRAALYKDAKLILFIRNNDTKINAIVIYNLLDDSFDIIDKLENMYIDVNANIYFEDIGFTINLTSVREDYFIDDNNSICHIKDDRIVNKYAELIFDSNSLEFGDVEIISELSLNNYKKNNRYC